MHAARPYRMRISREGVTQNGEKTTSRSEFHTARMRILRKWLRRVVVIGRERLGRLPPGLRQLAGPYT